MAMTKEQARALLKRHSLRATGPRLAVLRQLSEATRPLAFSEVVEQLGDADWDPATVYRNLIKLTEAGVTAVISQVGGMDRYALASGEDGHRHPHFLCNDCGQVACLPVEVTISAVEGPWAASIHGAVVQLRGDCPDCASV
jgi:Fur family ferric uptake transcriptional regulator